MLGGWSRGSRDSHHARPRSAGAPAGAPAGLAAALGACGASAGSPNARGNVSTSRPITPVATIGNGLPPNKAHLIGVTLLNQVTLDVDQQAYSTRDQIGVTIHNGLSTPIYAADHRTDCTTVAVERQQGGSWQLAAGCALASATRTVSYVPGMALVAFNGAQAAANGLPAGTYRASLTYSASANGGASATVYSPQFTIG